MAQDLAPAFDILVLGAGLAGTCAAAALARTGLRIGVIDAHAVHPPEFRAEKLGRTELALFDRCGLGAAARAAATPLGSVWLAQFGRLRSVCHNDEYGFAYATLINGLRAALPAGVTQFVGRIEAVETGGDRQVVRLKDGRTLTGRLIVVATGLGDAIRRMLAVRTVCEAPAFSLSLGLTMQAPASAFRFDHLVYHGERAADRVAYLTLFRIGETMRGNLFAYRTVTDPWTAEFRRDPEATLRRSLRRLEAFCGDLRLAGKPEVRPIDLVRIEDPARDGVVFVGDAFRTTCPVAGNGMVKALTDVDRLAAYVPTWMESPGMTAAKIAGYYADPAKVESDAHSLAVSRHTRDFKVETRWPWRARRLRSTVYRRTLAELRLARQGLRRLAPLDPAFPAEAGWGC